MATEKIGTLEFCSALNGDDPIQAITFLERFVETIRRERVEAFSEESHTIDDTDDDTDDDDFVETSESLPPRKKIKLDSWKLDTKSYNVPFVGTSTYKGSCGEVRRGEWPTGFLEAYLEQSPKAMEILGNGTGESPLLPPHGSLYKALLTGKDTAGKNLSVKMHMLYIQALEEIATCAIPNAVAKQQVLKLGLNFCGNDNFLNSQQCTANLEKQIQVKSSYHQLVSTIMKNIVSDLYTVLNNEFSNTGIQSQLIVEAVLTTLSQLSLTSVGAAREVVRGLDSNVKDGVLGRIAPYKIKEKDNVIVENKQLKRDNVELMKFAAFLNLSSIFLESDDTMIASYVISPGVKTTKTKPGIVYLTFRRVFDANTFQKRTQRGSSRRRAKYHKSLHRLLFAVQDTLMSSDDHGKGMSSRHSISIRSLIGMLHGDVLENLIRISHLVIAGDHSENQSIINFQNACKLMIRTLLCDSERSPFLRQLQSVSASESTMSSCKAQISRCIQVLLSLSKNMETRIFILSCFNMNPSIFSSFFRIVSVPSEPTPSFSCLSMYSLINFLIDKGPSTWSITDDEFWKSSTEKAVMHIMPRALTKNTLTKALQSSNSLLVLESLKLIGSVMKRLEFFINDVNSSPRGKIMCTSITDYLRKRLPDLQVLLSTRSRFDPFVGDANKAQGINFIVTMQVCEVIRRYISMFKSVIMSLQFDWIKILPESAELFCSVPLSLQNRVLRTLASIYDCYESLGSRSNTMATPKGFGVFSSIMIQSCDSHIYGLSRNLAMKSIQSVMKNVQRDDSVQFLDEELTLWIDVIDSDTIPTFCKLLEVSQAINVQHAVILSHSWQSYFPSKKIEETTFSPLISTSLVCIASEPMSCSESFVTAICKILTKILLSSFNPCLLASVIKYVFADFVATEEMYPATSKVIALFEYASTVLESSRDNILEKELALITILFGETNLHTKVAKYLTTGNDDDLTELNHIYFPMMKCNDNPNVTAQLVQQCLHYSVPEFCGVAKPKAEIFLLRSLPILLQSGIHFEIVKAAVKSFPSRFSCASMLVIGSSFACEKSSWHSEQLISPSQSMDLICSLLPQLFATLGTDLKERKCLSSRIEIIFTGGIIECIQSNKLMSIIKQMIEFCILSLSMKRSLSVSKPILHLLFKALRKKQNQVLHLLPIRSVFSLWDSLSRISEKDCETSSVQFLLGEIMAETLEKFEKYRLNGAYLMTDMVKSTPKHVVDTIFKNYSSTAEDLRNAGPHKLLLSMLHYDASIFAVPIINNLQKVDFETGTWDDVIAVTICESISQISNYDDLHKELFSRLADSLIRRYRSSMKSIEQGHFYILTKAIESLITSGQIDSKRFGEVTEKTSSLLQNMRKSRKKGVPSPLEMSYLEFLLKACSSEKLDVCLNSARQLLFVTLLEHLSVTLQKVLKIADQNLEVCADILQLTIKVLDSLEEATTTHIEPICLKRVLITCLKFGIQVESSESVSSYCLVLVQRVVKFLYSTPHLDESYTKESFTIHQIHAMIISHSMFSKLAMSRNSLARRELITLLICCVALDNGKSIEPVHFDTISALLVGYNASQCYNDRLVRRLLFLYESLSPEVPSFRQSDLFWGNAKRISESSTEHNILGLDHGQQWEHIIEALELRRIRQTCADFPLWEFIKPPKDEVVESWETADDEKRNSCNSNNDSEDDNLSISDDSAASIPMSTSTYTETNIDKFKVKHIGDKALEELDDRYSPAFIMPLVLGIFESFATNIEIENVNRQNSKEELDADHDYGASESHLDEENVEEREKILHYRESYVKVAYRLSQKGVISLSLSSLSSKCPGIRQIAVSILYFFLQALKMKEAQDIGQWRDRPQIEMILNSVQRGLAVARAKKIKQQKGNDMGNLLPPLFVPMLPAVSATFLARALFIVAKPDDDMYSSMNRYFLRIKDFHGAYNDCFSLPAFMTLFCSMNDDDNKSRKERLWALQLLKDGICDEYCYNVIARRHVTELLLSSFDGFCCRHSTIGSPLKVTFAFDVECRIIIETIRKCLEFGGMTSFSHMMKTVGFFSWVQVVIQIHILSNNAMSKNVRREFFLMLQSALQITEQVRSSEYLFFDEIRLAHNVICAYGKEKELITNKVENEPSSFTFTIVEILTSIHRLSLKNRQHHDCDHNHFEIHSNGLIINASLSLIQRVKNDRHLLRKAVGAICYLPVVESHSFKDTFVVDFCQSVLQSIIGQYEAEDDPKDVKDSAVLVLKRVSLLADLFKEEIYSNDKIIEMLIGSRRYMMHVGALDSWYQFTSSILTSRIQNDSKIKGDLKGTQSCIDNEYLNNLITMEQKLRK